MKNNNCKQRAFSLIELIGVMAVIAVMASVLMPSMIRQLRNAAAALEETELKAIAGGLENYIVRNLEIPDEKSWAPAVASELGRQRDEIITNRARSTRVYVIDPAFRVGPGSNDTLPYTQTSSGSLEPVSPRLAILSSLDPSKTIPIKSGVASDEEFDAIWSTADGEVPKGWTGRWVDSGEDLKIARLNLAPMFQRLILNNYDSSLDGAYSINGSTLRRVSATGHNAFYIEGTTVTLYDKNDVVESSQLLKRPATFVFERGTWRGQILEGLELTDDGVYLANTLFSNSELNSAALYGATPAALMDVMTDYMSGYADWDAADFGGKNYGNLKSAQANLNTVSRNLIYKTAPYPVESPAPADELSEKEKEKAAKEAEKAAEKAAKEAEKAAKEAEKAAEKAAKESKKWFDLSKDD